MNFKTQIGVELLSAFDEGDLVQVDKLFSENKRNVLEISQTELKPGAINGDAFAR